jgi:folate-binding protein YgfZ
MASPVAGRVGVAVKGGRCALDLYAAVARPHVTHGRAGRSWLRTPEKTITQAIIFPDRGVLRLGGPDARSLLQGLVTADLTRLADDHAVYTALLTPQGKYLFDFHVSLAPAAGNGLSAADGSSPAERSLLLETAADRLPDLERRLTLYRLRAAVTIEPVVPPPAVAMVFGGDAPAATGLPPSVGTVRHAEGLTFMVDPRLADLGVRVYGPPEAVEAWLRHAGIATVEPAVFARHRIALAVPAGGIDLVVDKTIMLEAGLDQLNAVAFDKGCFVGQELTARTHYRGLVKRRLVPLILEDAVVEPGFAVMAGEVEAGEIRSVAPGMALALLRLDRLGQPLAAGGGIVRPRPAPWQTDLVAQLGPTPPDD